MLTVTLDILGIALLATFAYFVWLPLPLLVVGLACLAASWQAERAKS